MNYPPVPKSQKAPNLARRAQSAAAIGSNTTIWDILSNKWDHQHNINGYLSVGVAENLLLQDTLLDYINTKVQFSGQSLTYNDGSMGSRAVREALSRFLNLHMCPVRRVEPSHVLLTNGCSSAVEQLSWAFMEPGEGILLGKPYYGTFIADLSVRPEAVVVPVEFGDIDPLSPEAVAQYEKAAVEFEKQSGKRVRAVMLCHPHNPLGRCYPRAAITSLMKLCQSRQMHLISDEIYALSTWTNKVDTDVPVVPFESVLSIDTTGLIDLDLVHVLWGMSKDFGANGLRVGAIISQSNPDLHAALSVMSLYSYVSGLSDQVTASILFDDAFTDRYIQLNREKLSEAHEFLIKILKKRDIEYSQGCNAGFFVWINLGKKYLETNPQKDNEGIDITDVIMQKLLDNKVFLASGTSFGSEKPGWFRVVFAHPFPYLQEAMRRILLAVGAEE
ncbi:acc synthase [Paecilomyces variotii No. 5]|uniref:Acc synthase n=1 Tax=Byssochlamys spectabilis (strain No. 5 / NBRC 109023) TaxID=1356009 RepID=V5GB33_BYSSN|nr:acc synthase [Paecilomyces variotii No. 5]